MKIPDVTIVDYGMGNLRSVSKAIERLGFSAKTTSAGKDLDTAKRLILPGVGAFAKAMGELNKRGLVEPLKAFLGSGKPFLGICLGLQLLFEESDEGEHTHGLGILAGRVVRFQKADKIPHMGWNQVQYANTSSSRCPLLSDIPEGTNFYFVHSYYPAVKDDSVSCLKTSYGEDFTSMIWRDNIFASQFHPEKSQADGLAMLRSFVSLRAN